MKFIQLGYQQMITTHNTKYQYIRFYDGREIFAMVREIDNKLELHFPMSILCKPAVTGGITIHLGPDVPFTNDDKVLVDREDIVVRTSISDQFVEFYDEACSAWLDIRDNQKINIKSQKEDIDIQKKEIAKAIGNRVKALTHKFEDDGFWEDELFEEEYEQIQSDLPTKDDIIH